MALGPVMLGIAGTRLDPEERELLAHPAAGGVTLFDRNYESPGQLADLVGGIHALREPRLLVSVDQEGGRVQRFRSSFTRLPAPATFGTLYEDDPERARELARDYGWLMAVELRAAGVDFSFAPVLDLGTDRSVVIGNRALHRDPEVVATLAQAIMGGMNSAGMCAVGKHFPGHGSVEGDSHLVLPVDDRDMERIQETDLLVFERMIHYGLPAIMAAHVVYSRIDERPAGFSSLWLKRVLRDELGFTGAVFSDDLGMAGAAIGDSVLDRARAALVAGCDVVLVCNDSEATGAVLEGLESFDSALRAVRLARMHGRKHVTWDGLRGSARYRELAGTIGSLDPSPELDLGDDTPM